MTRNEFNDALINRLIDTRIKRNLTQRQLAVASGIPQSTIASYERSRSDVSVWNLHRLATALRMNVKGLMP